MPYNMAFVTEEPFGWKAAYFTIDFMVFIDLVMNFFTTYAGHCLARGSGAFDFLYV